MLPIFETLTNLMQSFNDDEPKSPLHVGEVMNCWTYLTILGEAVAIEEIFLNMTTNPDLRGLVMKVKEGCISQHKRLTDFLLKEGVPMPPQSEPKPLSEPGAVPLGARFSDNEIANSISVKLATAIITCSTTAAEAVRNDVGIMFTKFQLEMMTYGLLVKTLMKKHGWIRIPPFFYPPGLPANKA